MEGGKLVCKTGKFCHIQELKGGEMVEVSYNDTRDLHKLTYLNTKLYNVLYLTCPFSDFDHGFNNSHQEEQKDVKSVVKKLMSI